MDTIEFRAVSLARQAVEHYLHHRDLLPPPPDLPPPLDGPGAAFVTLRVRKALRGCIGTLAPTRPTLAQEIIANAVAAATSDPRFPPVAIRELHALSYEVHVLGDLEGVAGENDLDPARFGVVVEARSRRGVLLPGIEEVTTPQQQVAIARAKALIPPDEAVTLYRFTVTRFRDAG